MRANPVVALSVRGQRATRIFRIAVQVRVHFFIFQGSMKPLQQAQLSRCPILDADMIEMLARIVVESSRHEAWCRCQGPVSARVRNTHPYAPLPVKPSLKSRPHRTQPRRNQVAS